MFKFIKDLLCEDDANEIYCPVRVIGASGFVILVLATLYMLVFKQTFNALEFAGGVSGLAGTTGAGAGIKAKLGG